MRRQPQREIYQIPICKYTNTGIELKFNQITSGLDIVTRTQRRQTYILLRNYTVRVDPSQKDGKTTLDLHNI